MPRHRTDKTAELKHKLIVRLEQGDHAAGSRFFSNRDLAVRFGVSYLTAHRLLSELVAEGRLERRVGSGTYVPGSARAMRRAQLIFSLLAKHEGSYGAQLLSVIRQQLTRTGLESHLTWETPGARLDEDSYPIIWASHRTMKTLCEQGRYGLFVGGIPPFAFRSDRIDAVALDNQYGGVCAARVLRDSLGPRKRLAVFASRKGDIQNDLRVGGFLFREPHARVVDAGGWLTEHGRKAAPELLRLGTDGVFCCNDSLAAALLEHCRRHRLVPPRVVGFDDAPVAEEMNLTTIATPWKGMARLVAEITSRRLAGDTGPAACHILSVRPVFRLSH